MANLMITKQCNLHCSYCFANEFVNKDRDIMSFENFMTCLKFLSHDPTERIGLIGGEPTLHPELHRMLETIIDSPFRSACLFTNGILVDRFINELRDSRFQILVNLNAPDKVGQPVYDKIIDNLDLMIDHSYMKRQVGVGINLHRPDMDYSYLLDAVRRFHLTRVRVSVSVPNMEEERKIEPLRYFHEMEGLVRNLVKDLVSLGAAPNFDCNYLPSCLFTEEDRKYYEEHKDVLCRSNLQQNPICVPSIDILPNLQVVRCFGMSEICKADLSDFRNTEELKRYFMLELDAPAYQILPDAACASCREYRAGLCSCGCYAYRAAELRKLRRSLKQGREIMESGI